MGQSGGLHAPVRQTVTVNEQKSPAEPGFFMPEYQIK
jgi:hypothetical protein